MERTERKKGFRTIRTATALSVIGVGMVSMLEANDISKKQHHEFPIPQIGQEQVEQKSDKLVFYTGDRNFILREKAGICETFKKLSEGRDIEIVNFETNEALLCIVPKSRQEITNTVK